VKVAIRPKSSPHNRYVELFAAAFEQAGWEVATLNWRIAPVLAGRLMILHWPDDFYASPDLRSRLLSWARIALMTTSRRLFGVRWIWVVHNLIPHDRKAGDPKLWRAFTNELDGLVFLSRESRQTFAADHPEHCNLPHLVTRHGDYRTGALTPPAPWRRPEGTTRLQFVGQIRPYKNLERLVEAARHLDVETELGVAGFAADGFGTELRRRGAAAAALHFDLRSAPLDEIEFERIVDSSHAAILPYRQILNSGSALFALSRNRPVIAPALGGLSELRDAVGGQWVYLYDGELTGAVLRDAAAWVRTAERPSVCRLDAYDWGVIGPELVRFSERLIAGARA
jgi:glycosyltransferase involved in cell wall biosynthesis